jgi:hypothetical protein
MIIELPHPISITRFAWRFIIPVWRTLRFPDGRYELEAGSGQIRWRYLGPHFSTIGTYEQRGNTLVPVGYKGPWEFGGQWIGDGQLLRPDAAEIGEQAMATFMRRYIDHGYQAFDALIDLN